ncbi:MAG TPA: amino acid adenylation domain-containing protein [Hyalangium sp.]|nr:amino acid adenylation domain-containing protein [Hyalangium sp.]
MSELARKKLLEKLMQQRRTAKQAQARPEVPVLPRSGPETLFPLSFAQQRLWFLEQLSPGDAASNIPSALEIRGRLDVAALERSLEALVARHETFRTRLAIEEGEPRQCVVAQLPGPHLRRVDLRSLPAERVPAELERLIRAEAEEPFELGACPLWRATLVQCAEQHFVLLLTMHHIVSDGWSMGVLVRELSMLYEAFSRGSASPLAPLPFQYADFAQWQRGWLQGERLDQQLAWWRKHLEGRPAVLELPTDRPRPSAPTSAGAARRMRVPAATADRLRALANEEGASLFMVLLAAFDVLLARYSGQESVVVGTPIANRGSAEQEGLIGFFVNTLALHTRVVGSPSFRALLRQVRDAALGAYAHQDLPFEKLVESLQPARSLSQTPLFQVMLVMQNEPAGPLALRELTLRPLELESQSARFDLTVYFAETEEGLAGTIEYSTELFDAATIARMEGHLLTLFEAVATGPDQRPELLPLLTAAERQQLLVEWNRTARKVGEERCIGELFKAVAHSRPEQPAAAYEGQVLTYRELNQRANQLAHHLRALGIRPDGLVGLCVERSLEMVVGILGVLKAGGAYVPLDPGYPPDRLAFMMEETRAPVLLTQRALASTLPTGGARVICLDADWESIARESVEDPPPVTHPDNLAYVIFTSGSTGRPKGVMSRHRSVANLIAVEREAFDVGPGARVLQCSAFSFDASVEEFLTTLLAGATLYLTPREAVMPGPRMHEVICELGITHLNLTPSALAALQSEALPGVKVVVAGGEACSSELVARWKPGRRFFNVCGPTETTAIATFAECDADGRAPPIGKPIANVRAYLLDAHLNPVPVGITGEIYISGVGVSRGYVDRPDMTAERYLPDPFSGEPGGRMYRSGDLGRYRPDGNIEVIGRIDHQVKVRGFRIELGEIEEVLSRHPGIREAAVLVREDTPGDKRLVAYVVPAEAPAPSVADLRAWLRAKLPEYMVPAFFVALERMPRTPNDKVDRRALPAPETGTRESFLAPRNGIEEVLASLWAQLLHLDRVGVRDGFFELGGHSLIATQLLTRIRQAFGVELPLRALFDASTVEAQAEVVSTAMRAGAQAAPPPLVPVDRRQRLPLSFAQQRLWFLDQLEPGSAAYNMPAAVRLTGALDREALEWALAGVVRRHEALRTTFDSSEGRPFQIIHAELPVPLPLTDWSGWGAEERARALREACQEEGRRPFDLGRGPLVRARLLRLEEREHVLLCTMHHIISDGWSVGVLVHEVAALYEERLTGRRARLPALPIQYADYAHWQQTWLTGEVLERALAYWKERLTGAPRALELPTDRQRPPIQTHRGAKHAFRLPPELNRALHALCRQQGATLFMGLLAAFKVLLSRYAGQEDVVVGTPIAHRTRAETEGLIGFFVNTLALRTDLSGGPGFRRLLDRVREVALGAFAHQDVPFEKLVEVLAPERDMGISPLFQVMFALQNAPEEGLHVEGLTLRELEDTETGTAKFDLTLDVMEVDGALQCSFEFNTDLFDREPIARMADHLRTLLEAVVAEPDRSITALPLLSEEERRQILGEWNATRRELPRAPFIHEWVEQQAERTPERAAVVFEERSLTYRELREASDRVAAALQARGVRPEVTVGLVFERSVEGVAALLGVLKAGGTYVPMDPAAPRERLEYMVSDSGARVLLTQRHLRPLLSFFSGEVLCLDVPEDVPASLPAPTRPALDGAHSAYVIYTSGSTGRPKGVQVSHANVLNSTFARHVAFPTVSKCYLMLAPFSFDPSVCGIFWTLINGGTLVLPPDALRESASEIPRLIARHRVTHLSFTPSLYSAVLDLASPEQLASLELIIVASEASPPALVERHSRVVPQAVLFNEYGPTESTVWATVDRCTPDPRATTVPIGRPISNMRAYVLDRHLNPVPPGVPGELYIAGDNLARGYFRRPELTAERFLPDPFAPVPGARMYRTGDLARFRRDGLIEFNGRVDHQVKIRGFRIELGEIEEVLTGHPGLLETAVIAREDRPGDKRLVAYVVAAEPPGPSSEELRAFLRVKLPEYMIPSSFVSMAALPLTANGKVDRRALPAPEVERAQEYVAPQGETEQRLAEIWAEVLGVPRVGRRDHFFELGGHSLLATQLISRVRRTFQVELPVRAIFDAPTLEHFAGKLVEGPRPETGPVLAPVPREGREGLPLSFAQQRLWILDQLAPSSPLYNVPAAVRLTGNLDPEGLRAALEEVVDRHEALRTTFEAVDGEPVQRIHPRQSVRLPLMDLSGSPEAEREQLLTEACAREAQRPFDLRRGPLLRARLLRVAPSDHVLLLVMHHIVSDGWSMGRLFRELAELYDAHTRGRPPALAPLPIQYADYAVWQRQWLAGEVLERQLAWWKERLAGAPAALELPTDRLRPAVQSFRGAEHRFSLPMELGRRLRDFGREQGTTPFMTLLAGFKQLLSWYSGQRDVVVGTPVAHRTREETEGLIGFFVNTLVLRTSLHGAPSFRELVGRVREASLGAYAHQDVPFEKLVEVLAPERDLARTPLFQVMFVLQNTPMEAHELPGLTMHPLQPESGTAKFDLTLELVETDGSFTGALEFNTDLFDRTTVERMATHLQAILEAAMAEPEARLSRLLRLPAGERQRILALGQGAARLQPCAGAHELFERQVEASPEAVALTFQGGTLSYRELDRRAAALARELRALGIGPDAQVGLCAHRSPELVVGMLGVLKAGGAYVPLDPSYPKERLALVLEDARPRVVLATEACRSLLPPTGATVLTLESAPGAHASEEARLESQVRPGHLAYVLYTSGSTGRPKGVMIHHGGLVNYLAWAAQAYAVAEGQGAPVHSPVGFDLTVTSLLVPLITGRPVELLPEAGDVSALSRSLLPGADFSLVKLTPAHLELLAHQLTPAQAGSARALVIGGEALLPRMLDFWRRHAPQVRLINEYGPTETVVGCCIYEVPRDFAGASSVPIGRPIAGTELYVLDERMEPVPLGVPGELYIGGAGLARGYQNRPELTAERFVPHPFSQEPGARLYRTGDLARYLADGNLEFLGRIDLQIKVRGFRIELGEIEAVLASHPSVREAAVTAPDMGGGRALVAYVVPVEGSALDGSELREFLASKLPDYMVPARWSFLPALPLTPNGKVDRRALPAPEAPTRPVQVAPRSEREAALARLFAEVLGLPRVGVTETFFELGGHSLSAVRMLARLREELGMQLPLRVLFESPTVEALARRIEEPVAQPGGALVPLREGGHKAPFFAVHPIGGSVFCYTELARLFDPERPFMALQARGLESEAPPRERIAEMAAAYTEELRRFRPHGPYLLGGWSMGGVVAFEMAQQLRRAGERVELVLIDSHLQPQRAGEAEPATALLASFLQDARALEGQDAGAEAWESGELTRDADLASLLEAAGLDPQRGQTLFEVFRAHALALEQYEARPYPGGLSLLRSSEGEDAAAVEAWRQLAAGEVRVSRLEAGHYDLLRAPHVQRVASWLRQSLDEAERP